MAAFQTNGKALVSAIPYKGAPLRHNQYVSAKLAVTASRAYTVATCSANHFDRRNLSRTTMNAPATSINGQNSATASHIAPSPASKSLMTAYGANASR